MKEPILEFNRYRKSGPNGDRSTTLVDYFDYEVKVNSFVVRVFDGYDHFYTGPKDAAEVGKEARFYVWGLSEALACACPDLRTFNKQVVQQPREEWVDESRVSAHKAC